ncbi:Toll-like receptor 13 [Varanus komodoensis]|uniref:toll-like receptor 13 n=1 Tax=Varanus komodoensis TaxID=61221 RepID=UPI001CF7B4B8|nr:toll-like receptor 13 [Varanus komodoensis]KAF7249275.1 Toll-like receptor 13 [Varanus komodoensis]
MFLQFVTVLLFLFNQDQKASSYSLKNCEVHGLLTNRTKVLCYDRQLTHVPAYLPSKLFFLDVSQNNITSLRKSDFTEMSNLHILNVSQNKIGHIEEGAFVHTSRMEILNLTTNQLHHLTSFMFDGLFNLTVLLLGNNQISRIEPSAFAHLEKLKVIDLSSNQLYTMNAVHAVFEVESLEELHIKDNGLQNLSTTEIISVLVRLRELDASHNPISLIDIATPALQSLLSLDVSYSTPRGSTVWLKQDPCFLKGLKIIYLGGMAMIPSNISALLQMLNCSVLEIIHLNHLNLTESDGLIEKVCLSHPNVKTLNLQGNRFTSIEAETFENCTQLRSLNMSSNRLNMLPPTLFQSLHFLQVLSLVDNKFTSVPNATSNITSLESLDLGFNKFHIISPADFINLPSIKSLCIIGNHISHVHSDLFGSLYSLQELNLGENHLRKLKEPFSAGLAMLKTLLLNHNNLASIKKGIFKNLTSLRVLNLVDNQIVTIEPGAWEGLNNLRSLVLGSNRITRDTLQDGTFQGVSSLEELQLFSNYISYESTKSLANPPFQHLHSLKKLAINSQRHNGFQNFPVNFLEGLHSIVQIHAGNLAISSLEPETFKHTPTLQELDLSENNLISISNTVFSYVPNLKELHLNKNRLNSLSFVSHVNLSKLTVIRVTRNLIDIITKEQIRALPNLLLLDAQQNTFTCSCDNQMFLNWSLQNPKTQVLHFYQYTCASPPAFKGKKLLVFKKISCISDCMFILYVANMTAVLLLMLVCFFYQWRMHMIYSYYLLLAYFIDKRQKRKGQCMEYDYDAFLSYNKHDEQWVINDLLPVLENQYCWKLCLHHRDFQPGRPILENIVDNIYASRKTICIISHHYLNSEWCSKEIQVASFRIFDDCKDVLVLIFLEDIPSEYLSPYHRMRELVKKKTYLKWPKDEQEIPLFWLKLNMAMKTGERKEDENPILA